MGRCWDEGDGEGLDISYYLMDKQKVDFKNSLMLLRTYLESYEKGDILMYLPMAVELRKLICDKEPSLLSRVIPEIKLYKLHTVDLFERNPNPLSGLEHMMPGRLNLSRNPPTFNLLFTPTREKMELKSWTSQLFFNEGITIRELIKSVADKEAAHSDEKYNDTLLHCQKWTFNDTSCHVLGIYGISRFVYDLARTEYSKYLL